jgi:hypothetical protein
MALKAGTMAAPLPPPPEPQQHQGFYYELLFPRPGASSFPKGGSSRGVRSLDPSVS